MCINRSHLQSKEGEFTRQDCNFRDTNGKFKRKFPSEAYQMTSLDSQRSNHQIKCLRKSAVSFQPHEGIRSLA